MNGRFSKTWDKPWMLRRRVVVKEPSKKPRLLELDVNPFQEDRDSFKEIRVLLAGFNQHEGHAELLKFNDRLKMAVNEDGRWLRMPLNFMMDTVVIRGPAIIARWTSDGVIDMTDVDIADTIRFFGDFEQLKHREVERCFRCDRILDGTPHVCV